MNHEIDFKFIAHIKCRKQALAVALGTRSCAIQSHISPLYSPFPRQKPFGRSFAKNAAHNRSEVQSSSEKFSSSLLPSICVQKVVAAAHVGDFTSPVIARFAFCLPFSASDVASSTAVLAIMTMGGKISFSR